MWYDNTQGGEFEVPIGAVVKFSDTGQIQLVDDDEEVSNLLISGSRDLVVYCRNTGWIRTMLKRSK